MKPLRWRDVRDWGAEAPAFGTCIFLVLKWSKGYQVKISYPGGYSEGSVDGKYYPTIQDAKDAAQAFYDAEVRKLVEVVL